MRVADRQRAVGHQKWRGIEPAGIALCLYYGQSVQALGGVVEGHCWDVACVSFADNPCGRDRPGTEG